MFTLDILALFFLFCGLLVIPSRLRMSSLNLEFLRISKILWRCLFLLVFFTLPTRCLQKRCHVNCRQLSRKSRFWANPHVVDRLCQAKLHRGSRCVGCYFWGHHRFSLTRHSRDLFCHENSSNHDSPVFLFPLCSVSLSFPSPVSVAASRQRGRSRARYREVRVRARPKKRKEKLTRLLLLHSGPHNIPCPSSCSTFLLARATAVVLALTPRCERRLFS